MNETVNIIEMLVGLIYDLYPDDEYADLYDIDHKIAQAQKFVDYLRSKKA